MNPAKVHKTHALTGRLIAVHNVDLWIPRRCTKAASLICFALLHIERLDPKQVLKGRVRNGLLIAAGHVELLNPAQMMHEGSVRDGRLVAVGHVERLDPTQVHEGSVSDGRLIAGDHFELLDPAR